MMRGDEGKGAIRLVDLSDIPNFCGHEHWGSIASIGSTNGGFRADVEPGATPQRPTTLLDLILDPYFRGFLETTGLDPASVIAEATGMACPYQAAIESPVDALGALRPHLRNHTLTGAYQCLRRGIEFAHDFDLMNDDPEAMERADRTIRSRYADIFTWYRELMKQARFSGVIRPVHPDFYGASTTGAAEQSELSFTHTIMRIDPLLALWREDNPCRRRMAEMVGVEPADAASWRSFLDALFDLAARRGTTGIKQLQAYERPLVFGQRSDSEVRFRGDLSPDEQRVLEDWVMHECFKRADDRGWPHQIHVGTHNLPDSNPLPLAPIARRYGRQKLVLLHCWPFANEAGWLAKQYPNVYVDACWQTVLNPAFLRDSLRRWLGYLSSSKIMLSHDATSIEMAAGSSLITREILSDVLQEIGTTARLGEAALRQTAMQLLNDNVVQLYDLSLH